MENKKQKTEIVAKHYLKGLAFDRRTTSNALKFFAGLAMMAILFVVLGMMITIESRWLNVAGNLAVVLSAYLFFLQIGQSAGGDAVNLGEIMYAREEKGRPVAAWERGMCYHPLKGLVSGLLGSLPICLISLVLACIAELQVSSLGVLPSWLSSVEGREEIGAALTYYHEAGVITLESVLRVVVRMSTMPFVNMIGAENAYAMLILERMSPVLNLLPAVAYGVGYLGGVRVRTSVHTSIAQGKKKAQRKRAKELRARRQNRRSPDQLN